MRGKKASLFSSLSLSPHLLHLSLSLSCVALPRSLPFSLTCFCFSDFLSFDYQLLSFRLSLPLSPADAAIRLSRCCLYYSKWTLNELYCHVGQPSESLSLSLSPAPPRPSSSPKQRPPALRGCCQRTGRINFWPWAQGTSEKLKVR